MKLEAASAKADEKTKKCEAGGDEPLSSRLRLPHRDPDIAFEGFQRLEDLATSYWYSEVLFASLELKIFDLLEHGPATAGQLAARTGYDANALSRFLSVLSALALIIEHDGTFSNGPLASNFLIPGKEAYLGDFLLYRRYLGPHWQRLGPRIREGAGVNERSVDESPEHYGRRTLAYVRALDLQARLKSAESLEYLKNIFVRAPRRVLDVAGGAGAWCRALLNQWPGLSAVLLELPDTIDAARRLYPKPEAWDGIETVAGSVLEPCIRRNHFDLIVMSNIIHAYGPSEAKEMLREFACCLAPEGTVLVHDYLCDIHDTNPEKGALYDLHMLINTYNGRVYKLEEMVSLLSGAGLGWVRFFHLKSDTSVFLARPGRPKGCSDFGIQGEDLRISCGHMLEAEARKLGFSFARVIEAGRIATGPWVRLKCRYGCPVYGRSLCCPPASPGEEEMQVVISGYRHALLVQGSPPAGLFHEHLLALEKSVFLAGYPEALAFGAGPCPVCPACPEEGVCRFPEKARPSMEACGVDVYETAHRAGLSLNPVSHRRGYVKYVGLVLFGKKGSYASPAASSRIDA